MIPFFFFFNLYFTMGVTAVSFLYTGASRRKGPKNGYVVPALVVSLHKQATCISV